MTPGPVVTRGRVTMAFLALSAVLDLLRLTFVASESAYLRGVARGETISLTAAHASDDRIAATSGLAILLLIATAIAWCMWQHRAQRNLGDLGRVGLRFTPGWAAGWWFVPIANLFKPFQSVRELWKASEPVVDGSAWFRSRSSPLIGWWWACWLSQNVVSWTVRGQRSSHDLNAIIAGDYWWMASDALLIIAAILAILIVRSVIERQAALMSLDPLAPAVPAMPVAFVPPPPPMPPMA